MCRCLAALGFFVDSSPHMTFLLSFLSSACGSAWCSSLQEVGIPPGPRLIMLNHIDQYRHILKPAMPLPGPPKPFAASAAH